MQISGAEYVIGRFGGLAKTARALSEQTGDKFPVTTVQGWKDRKRVPQEHWSNLISAARALGFEITLEDFLKEHAQEAEAA